MLMRESSILSIDNGKEPTPHGSALTSIPALPLPGPAHRCQVQPHRAPPPLYVAHQPSAPVAGQAVQAHGQGGQEGQDRRRRGNHHAGRQDIQDPQGTHGEKAGQDGKR